MPESKSGVKHVMLARSEAIRVLQIIRGYFVSDESDPALRLENWRYRTALDMAIEALKPK